MSFYSSARITTTVSGTVTFSQSGLDASTPRVGFVPSEDSLSLFNQLANADANKVDIKTHYSSVNWDSSVTGYRLSTPYFVNYYNGTTTKFLAITDIISAYGSTMLLFPDAIQNWINEGSQISNYVGVPPASGWDVVSPYSTSPETTFSITYGLIGVYDGSGRLYFSSTQLVTSYPSFQERIGFVVSGSSTNLFNYLADSDPNKVDLKSIHPFTWSPIYPITGYRLSTPVYVNYFNGTETKLLACTDITNGFGHTCFLFPDAFDNWVNDGKVLQQGYSAPSDGFDVVTTGATFEITSAPPDTEIPVITLVGDASITITQGSAYTEQGATWTDNADGSGNATVGGDTVDTSTLGSYVVTYNYTDAAGNVATEVTRTITVMASSSIRKVISQASFFDPSGTSQYFNGTARGYVLIDNWDLHSWVKTQPHTVLASSANGDSDGVMRNALGLTTGNWSEVLTPDFDLKVQVSNGSGTTEYSVTHIGHLLYTYVNGSKVTGGTSIIVSPEHTYYTSTNVLYDTTQDFNPPDTESPVITLVGDASITLTQGDTYTEQGATWTDNVDGSGNAVVTGSVDTSTVGTYTITYNYTDAAGNVATEVSRTVDVVTPPDTEIPVITLTGDASITLTQGDTYTEQGATWTDNVDGSGDAVVTGSVDTSTVGTYTITYNYTDAAGNVATEVSRTVDVIVGRTFKNFPEQIENIDILRTGLSLNASYSQGNTTANYVINDPNVDLLFIRMAASTHTAFVLPDEYDYPLTGQKFRIAMIMGSSARAGHDITTLGHSSHPADWTGDFICDVSVNSSGEISANISINKISSVDNTNWNILVVFNYSGDGSANGPNNEAWFQLYDPSNIYDIGYGTATSGSSTISTYSNGIYSKVVTSDLSTPRFGSTAGETNQLQFSTTHNSGCVLTNNNTTAQTSTFSYMRAVGSSSVSSGKLSFEFTIDQIAEGIFLGITSEENPDSSNVFVGASNNSYGIYARPNFGYVQEYNPGVQSPANYNANVVNGDTIAFTFDADNGKIHYSVNGGTVFEMQGVPGGTYYPVIGTGSSSKSVIATISEGEDISISTDNSGEIAFSTTYNNGATLSNNNTTAETSTTTFRRAVSSTSASSGKLSFEFTIDQIADGIFLGITSEENPDSSNVFVGSSNNSYGIYARPNFGYVQEYNPGVQSPANYNANVVNGDTIAFTFDADNGKIHYSVNGGTVFEMQGVPAGTYYPVIGSGAADKSVIATISEGQDITIDVTAPVITLVGDAEITVNQGEAYVEQGATWTDNVDGTGDATATGSVDTSVVGSYTITYNYTDAAGNSATEVTRTVNVVAVTTPPSEPSCEDVALHLQPATGGEILDKSGTNHSITTFGDTIVDNVNTLFGGGTINFDGAGDYLSVPASNDWNLDAGDFTIEFWVYLDTLANLSTSGHGSGASIIGNATNNSANSGWLFYLDYRGLFTFLYSNSSGSFSGLGANLLYPLETKRWYHIAVSREGNTLRGFVDGAKLTETAFTSYSHSTRPLEIGRRTRSSVSSIQNYFSGQIQDIRISKKAVYTDNFTPPTSLLATCIGQPSEPTTFSTTTVIDSGSGYTEPGTDVPTTGGSGTGLKVSYDVGDDGGVKDPTVTDDGTGYQDGDEVEIPGGTTPAVLLVDIPGGINTNSILYKIGRAIKTASATGGVTSIDGLSDVQTSGTHVPTDGQALIWDQTMGHWMPKDQTAGVSDFLALSDTPTTYSASTPNLRVNDDGTALEFVGNNFVVDGEFRGMMNNLLHHNPYLMIYAGDEHDITNISKHTIVWRTSNDTIRYLRIEDEYGAGGNDYFIRIDGGEPTCDGGGDYDPETNTCFPNTENVVAASTFQGVYDPNLASVASGSYAYSAKIRILKTGLYATGWIDVHQMYTDLNTAGANIASNDSDIANLQSDVATLQAGGGGSAATYTKATLPLNGSSADLALVTDGTISGDPTMAYFYQGKWFRTLDNSEITDQTIDIFLLAGQSNAHGHAVVSDLDANQLTQDGLFYTSWHNNTSNASSTQYYSSWATSLVAGNTRGDSNSSTLGGSSLFGPELGFVERANAINLTDGQPIGVLKHAIGASSLTDVGGANDLSDWDLTATGDKKGDALRAFKLAIADGLTKLTNAGYSYRLAGMIWWQGESGGADSDLIAFIDHIRTWLDDNSYLSTPKAQFPFVITGTTDYWGRTYETNVAGQDEYIGFVNTQDLAAPAWADRTLVHPGSTETYNTDQDDVNNGYTGSVGDSVGGPDFNGDGVNDMFAIGRAYADQMQLAKSGSTNASWDPSSITTRLWLDMDDQTTFTSSAGNVTAIADKSGNNYTFNAASGSTLTAVNTAQNNKNILRFDNNSDATSNTSIAFSSTAVHKWFFVVKVTSSDAYDALVTYSKGNPTLQMIMFNFSGAGVFSGDWYMNPGNSMTGNSTNLLNQWVMLSAEFDIPNGQATLALNATEYNTNVAQSGLSTMGAGSVKLNDYQNNADSDWGEIVFVEDVTQSNSDKIEGYLAHKWGLTADLPESHPYKTSAP